MTANIISVSVNRPLPAADRVERRSDSAAVPVVVCHEVTAAFRGLTTGTPLPMFTMRAASFGVTRIVLICGFVSCATTPVTVNL